MWPRGAVFPRPLINKKKSGLACSDDLLCWIDRGLSPLSQALCLGASTTEVGKALQFLSALTISQHRPCLNISMSCWESSQEPSNLKCLPLSFRLKAGISSCSGTAQIPLGPRLCVPNQVSEVLFSVPACRGCSGQRSPSAGRLILRPHPLPRQTAYIHQFGR